jgi:hypothetical protein
MFIEALNLISQMGNISALHSRNLSMVIIFIPKTAIIVFAEKVDSSEPVNC